MALTVLPGVGLATPSRHEWKREMMLGANETAYFYLLTQSSNPGTYYAQHESLFVCSRSSIDHRVTARILLRAVSHTRDIDTGEGSTEETHAAPLDLVAYLRDHDVRPAYFETWWDEAGIDKRGVYLEHESEREHFMTRAELKRRAFDAIQARRRGRGPARR